MKRKTTMFLDRAKESLIVAVEIFNRPSEIARLEGVLLMANHAFEMLLKAVVFEKTSRIRGKKEKYNYGFDKCVAICENQLSVLDPNEVLSIKNLNGFRDAAAHDIVDLSEGLLYAHIEQAVLIFGAVLKRTFGKDLARWLPRRILPISASLPNEITAIVSEDMSVIGGLLGKGKRREDDAQAALRPYQVIEKNIRESQGLSGKETSTKAIIRKLKKTDWRTALPMVAGLVQPEIGGIPIHIHVNKKSGFSVRIDPNASAAIAFKYARDEDRYPYLTSELAGKLGIKLWQVVELVKIFRLKGNTDFHNQSKISRSSYVQRYNEKARKVLADALALHGFDDLWRRSKTGESIDPREYVGNDPIEV
ncbi:MAG: hypothetical protein Q7S58_15715 [Candidatus Binatus sp.]|uniref:DUF3644 domain-containing protein n=1 Tax=Candidatus Binatus sp. TaxID=2811406 RepID=UPI0027206B76|nr:DUF3644 domain-containing protein [Candidatus Binatus sp.]MDO8433848.1 hypothetical protein [Candidatus Binatus sp.]